MLRLYSISAAATFGLLFTVGCTDDASRVDTARSDALPPPVIAPIDRGWSTATPQEWSEGNWTYDSTEDAALFGQVNSEAVFSVQCTDDALRLVRSGDAPAGTDMQILLSNQTIVVPAQRSTNGVAGVSGDLSLDHPAIFDLIDASSPYIIEVAGMPRLTLRPTDYINRVVEACRA